MAAGQDTLLNPTVTTSTSTHYTLTVSNGTCESTDFMFVDVISITPANAGTDVTINEGDVIQIGANTDPFILYSWSPITGIMNNQTNVPNPFVSPTATTTYTLTVEKFGCVKTDDIVVTVIPNPLNILPLIGVKNNPTTPTMPTIPTNPPTGGGKKDPFSSFGFKVANDGVIAQVYPNPITNNLLNCIINTTKNETVVIDIMDMTGRVLQTQKVTLAKGNHEIILTLNDYPNATYLMRINGTTQQMSHRFIIMK